MSRIACLQVTFALAALLCASFDPATAQVFGSSHTSTAPKAIRDHPLARKAADELVREFNAARMR
jgi:hypothetical protein